MSAPSVRRHRLFETNWPRDGCARCSTPRQDRRIRAYYGKPGWAHGHPAAHRQAGTASRCCAARSSRRRPMGIDWMTCDELAEAIPPAYTELIGHQLLQHLRVAA